jgi:NNP family nitrate/nitrite transporter-like MFS transporter
MMPLYLVSERHMDQETANLWVALSRLTGLGMAFVAGWASDRLGPKRAMTGVLILAGLSTLGLGMTSGGWLLFFLFLQPMLAVCFFPPAFASLSRVGPTDSRSVTVSLTLPPAFLAGGGLLPPPMGWVAAPLSFGWGIGLFGAMVLAAALLVGRLDLGPRPQAR